MGIIAGTDQSAAAVKFALVGRAFHLCGQRANSDSLVLEGGVALQVDFDGADAGENRFPLCCMGLWCEPQGGSNEPRGVNHTKCRHNTAVHSASAAGNNQDNGHTRACFVPRSLRSESTCFIRLVSLNSVKIHAAV